MTKEWGFLRETTEDAISAGLDKDTGLSRTGLNDYLKVIFPETIDWVHDTPLGLLPDGTKSRKRPDYRSESLKMIIEFDGIQHYTKPDNIIRDIEHTEFYRSLGYSVVRIPYFIQLSRKAVKTLFGIDVGCELFDETIPSLGIKGQNTPAYLCGAGVARMAKEFLSFPEQYKTNIIALKKYDNEMLTGVSILTREYEFLYKNSKELH